MTNSSRKERYALVSIDLPVAGGAELQESPRPSPAYGETMEQPTALRDNPIRRLMSARLERLKLEAEAVGAAGHSSTVGAVREALLTQLLRELLPPGVSVASGVICDAFGEMSPQLDIIVTFDDSLPSIAMKDGVAVVPVEAALLAIEVKSTLKSEHLQQVTTQNAALASMRPCGNHKNPGAAFMVPTVIVAYQTEVSKEVLEKWMQRNRNAAMVAVVGVYIALRSDDRVEFGTDALQIASFLNSALRHLRKQREQTGFEGDLTNYLAPLAQEI